jgi:peptidoglycan-associated lipoprotein
MKIKTILLSASLLTLAACASTPEEVPVVQKAEPIVEVQEPVEVTPAPQAPVFVEPTLPPGPVPGSIEDFVATSGDDRVYFAYNQYDLSTGARDVLRAQAQWLQQYENVNVIIGGNADERGTREYNLALGARRADSVKAFLVSQGVNPNRVTTVSYGKERPIDGGSNEASWALNRNAHSAVLIGGGNQS